MNATYWEWNKKIQIDLDVDEASDLLEYYRAACSDALDNNADNRTLSMTFEDFTVLYNAIRKLKDAIKKEEAEKEGKKEDGEIRS